jgi:hypothetical protein
MWLKKAFDQAVGGVVKRSAFVDESAIAEFGVGKNMVASIRHWALGVRGHRGPELRRRLPRLADRRSIFADDGYDPYSEHPTTAWYCHLVPCGRG